MEFAAPNPPAEEGTPSSPRPGGHRRRATPTSAQEEMEGITETGVLRTDITGSDDDHTTLLSSETNMENSSRSSLKSTQLGFTTAPNGVVPTSPPRMPSLGGGTGGAFFNELMELRQSRGSDDLPARLGKLEPTGGGAAVRLTPVRRPHHPPPHTTTTAAATTTTASSFITNHVAATPAAQSTDVTEEGGEPCSAASCCDGAISVDRGSALAGAPELRTARRHLSDRESDCQMLDLSARFADEVSLSSPRKRPRTSRAEGRRELRRKIRSQFTARQAGHMPPRIVWGEEMERQVERARKARELKRLALQRGSRQAFIDSARADAWAAACIQAWWRRLREEGHDTTARVSETSTAFRGHLRNQSPDEEREERRKVLETLAASIIQIWYRRMRAEHRIVEGLREECGHLAAVLEVAFAPPGRSLEAALRMIKDETLTSHASIIIRIMSWFRSSNLSSHACFNTPKTFLGHIVITSHPEVVFNEHTTGATSESVAKQAHDTSEGASDVCLYLSAKRLKNSLMAVYVQLQSPMASRRSVLHAMRQMVVVYGQYLTHFADWQKLDGSQLADEVTSAVMGVFEVLARTDRELQNYVHSADAARQEVNLEKLYGYENVIRTAMTQLEKLEETLTRVVGAEEACARMEEARAAAQQIVGEETRREGVLDMVSYNFGDEGREAEVDLGEAGHDGTAATATAGDRGNHGETPSEMPLDAEAGEREGVPRLAAVTAEEARSGGDRESVDDGLDGTPDSLLDNEWLVHEIMMLPKGKFLQVSLEDAKARGAAPGPVGEGADDGQGPGYWETVTQMMASGDYRPLLVLVQELAERLSSLTPNRPDLGEEVNEALDIELLDQMLQKDVLDSATIFSILRFAGERVLWLEAPARNDSTEEWLVKLGELEQTIGTVPLRFATCNPQDRAWVQVMGPQFEFLLEKVDQIHVDIFNSHIRKATPVIRAHGVNFERARFVERVEAGQITLDRTRAWLDHVLESDWARGQTVTSTDRRSPQCLALIEALGVGREDAVVMFLRRAYSRILCHNLTPSNMVGFDAEVSAEAVLTEDNLPETLSLDAQRIDGARQGALVVARSATLAAYLGQTLSGRLSMQDRLEAIDQLMVLLPEEDVRCEDIRIQMVQFARSLQAKSGLPPLAPQELTTLDGRVAHMLTHGACPVLHLFYQRAVDVMHTMLAQDANMTPEEAEALCRGVSLTGLGSYLLKLSEGLLVVCRHNEGVFKSLYSRIIMDSMTPQ